MAAPEVAENVMQQIEATHPGEERTPVTPTPLVELHVVEPPKDSSNVETPTQPDFAGVAGQQPLPDQPLTSAQDVRSEPQESLKRDSSHASRMQQDPGDVEMGDGEEDGDEDGSDNDSVTSDSKRPSKKKKGQRFFCTEFPPCQLSFTRSEHLARHIRKHTGERPFQCHCSRRFSRLDNLRQHAQTVHVNEEIPAESLAATSTRFQRQIRTDRVRPPANRSRGSTIGSNGGHSRGHSRNLSTSSIGSTASSMGMPEDSRKRPQPLAMANDPSPRARLTLDTYNTMSGTPLQPPFQYYNQSPTAYSTPTSTTFSTGPGSPRFHSSMASPASTISRSSFYNGARRRLSVPSGQNPFQQYGGNTYPPPMSYAPLQSGTTSTFSQNSSVYGSPTGSIFSHGRRESDAELEFRRRTWHPGTYSSYTQRPATSGLSYHQTPDDHGPALSGQPAASQVTRLPGIESFDHAPPPNARQPSSPMLVDTSPRPPSSHRPSDAGLHQGLTRLDIAAANTPQDAPWQPVQPQMVYQQAYVSQQAVTVAPQQVMQRPPSMPESPVTPRKNKRQAWYGGPVTPVAAMPQRPSPEDSGSSDGVHTPNAAQVVEYHPVIINPSGPTDNYPQAAGMPEEQKSYATNQQAQTYALQAGHDPRFAHEYAQQPRSDMNRLEALVAVATSENRAVERS